MFCGDPTGADRRQATQRLPQQKKFLVLSLFSGLESAKRPRLARGSLSFARFQNFT